MQYVTVIQNLENNSMDFIMHWPMDTEELEEKVYEQLWIDLDKYNRQTYETDGILQRHFVLNQSKTDD